MKTDKIESFAKAMNRAENLEKDEGKITDEILAIRKWAKEKYPALFEQYFKNKTNKAGSHGEIIHSNFFGQQRMSYFKKNRPK